MTPKRKDASNNPDSSQTPAVITDGDTSGDASLLPGGPGTSTAPQTNLRGSQTKRGRVSPSLNPEHAADASGAVSASNTGTRTAAVAQQPVADGVRRLHGEEGWAEFRKGLSRTEQHTLPSLGTTAQPQALAATTGKHNVYVGHPLGQYAAEQNHPQQAAAASPSTPGLTQTVQEMLLNFAERTTMSSGPAYQGSLDERTTTFVNGWFDKAQHIKRAFDERTASVNQAVKSLIEKMAVEARLRRDNARLAENLESERRTVASLHSNLWLVRSAQLQKLGVPAAAQVDVNPYIIDIGCCWACMVVPATVTIVPCGHQCLCWACFEGASRILVATGHLFCCPICQAPASLDG